MLVLVLAGCGLGNEPQATRSYRLAEFSATTDGAVHWTTYDTTANTYRLELTGSPTAGALRSGGEWWARVTSPAGQAVVPVLRGGFAAGTFVIWNDTMYVYTRTWLDALAFTGAGRGWRGRYADATYGDTIAILLVPDTP